ncbi:unnamed protein product [Taenia asiatica]|uniref:Uncharacterized protein n=1 Tax=Taenia asiatica TaxID=60517 RepID=A0A0R3VYT4_TAEAS|nr:unnamed protein product [Taenia asiatica]
MQMKSAFISRTQPKLRLPPNCRTLRQHLQPIVEVHRHCSSAQNNPVHTQVGFRRAHHCDPTVRRIASPTMQFAMHTANDEVPAPPAPFAKPTHCKPLHSRWHRSPIMPPTTLLRGETFEQGKCKCCCTALLGGAVLASQPAQLSKERPLF